MDDTALKQAIRDTFAESFKGTKLIDMSITLRHDQYDEPYLDIAVIYGAKVKNLDSKGLASFTRLLRNRLRDRSIDDRLFPVTQFIEESDLPKRKHAAV